MMNEHKKLKEIIDLIGYNMNGIEMHSHLMRYEGREAGLVVIDVREIIFTPEFMGEYIKYKGWGKDSFGFSSPIEIGFKNTLMENLDNPVEYLHNLLLGNK